MHRFIKNYIDGLTINDIKVFACSNGAILSDNELSLIYKYVKNDWQTIIFGNPNKIFNDLKENLTSKNYQIMINLFNIYKDKFKNYL